MDQHDIDDYDWEGEEPPLTEDEFTQFLGFEFITENITSQRVDDIMDEFIEEQFGNPDFREQGCGCELEPGSSAKCRNTGDCTNRQQGQECPDHCGDGCCNQPYRNQQFKTKFRIVHRHGRGFALVVQENVAKNDYVLEYVGEVYVDTENPHRDNSSYVCEMGVNIRRQNLVVEPTRRGNLGRFLSHSDNPNCQMIAYRSGSQMHLVLVAIKHICPGTELTWNYGVEFRGLAIPRCLCLGYGCDDRDDVLESMANSPRQMNINREVVAQRRQQNAEAEAAAACPMEISGSSDQVEDDDDDADYSTMHWTPLNSPTNPPWTPRHVPERAAGSSKRRRSDPTTPPEKKQQKKQRRKSSSEESVSRDDICTPVAATTHHQPVPAQPSQAPPMATKKPKPIPIIVLNVNKPNIFMLQNANRSLKEVAKFLEKMMTTKLEIPRCSIPRPPTASPQTQPQVEERRIPRVVSRCLIPRPIAPIQAIIHPHPRPCFPNYQIPRCVQPLALTERQGTPFDGAAARPLTSPTAHASPARPSTSPAAYQSPFIPSPPPVDNVYSPHTTPSPPTPSRPVGNRISPRGNPQFLPCCLEASCRHHQNVPPPTAPSCCTPPRHSTPSRRMRYFSPQHEEIPPPRTPAPYCEPPLPSPSTRSPPVRQLRSRQINVLALPCSVQAAMAAQNVDPPETEDAPEPPRRRAPGRPKTRQAKPVGPPRKVGRPKTNPDAFQCEECGAVFLLKHVLENHLTIHSEDRRFACPQCPERFKNNQTLQSHIRRRHIQPKDKTMFKCPYCPWEFDNIKDCKKHQGRKTNACKTDRAPIVIRPEDRQRQQAQPNAQEQEGRIPGPSRVVRRGRRRLPVIQTEDRISEEESSYSD